jgi:hypothetical protein
LNNDSRVINEIRRLKQTSWNKKEEDNCVLGQEDNPEYFYELKEGPAPSTTGFLDTILKEIEARSDQLDLGGFNIIWASSKGMHYRATFIEDAALYYSIRLYKKSIAQPQIVHLMPKNLSTLG